LPSVNGQSVSMVSSPERRTVVAVLGGKSPPVNTKTPVGRLPAGRAQLPPDRFELVRRWVSGW